MTLCLVIQKDTLENGKVKTVLKVITETPEEFVNNLQEGHCIPYQLVAHTVNNLQLFNKITGIVSDYKTSYGKDWYELDSKTLSKVVTLFLETGETWINFPTINNIFGVSIKIFPIVTKEIKIVTNEVSGSSSSSVSSVSNKEEIVSLIENLKEDGSRRKKKNNK